MPHDAFQLLVAQGPNAMPGQCQAQFLVLSRSCPSAQPFTIQFHPQDVAAPRREAALVRQQASRKLVGAATRDPVNFLAILPNRCCLHRQEPWARVPD